MFIQIKDGQPFGYPVTDDNFRLLIPSNVSLPKAPLTKDILDLGFAIYEFSQIPEPAPSEFKVVEEGTPQWTSDDIRGDFVTQVWIVRDMTDAEKADAIAAQWNNVRLQRNSKLFSCDWTQLPDAPVTEVQKLAWQSYRQDLRNVTNQPDPFNITWPVEPT